MSANENAGERARYWQLVVGYFVVFWCGGMTSAAWHEDEWGWAVCYMAYAVVGWMVILHASQIRGDGGQLEALKWVWRTVAARTVWTCLLVCADAVARMGIVRV